MQSVLLKCFCLLPCITGVFGVHPIDIHSSGDYDLCFDFKRPAFDLTGITKEVIGDKLHKLSEPKIKIIRGFRGERVPLRCQHTQRNSRFYWFISDRIPIGSESSMENLIPLPKSQCFQRDYHGYSTMGVEVLTVIAQRNTVGWFTCIEYVNGNQFYQREIFSLLLVQPASVALQVDLSSQSSTNCEIAKGRIANRAVSFERQGVNITFKGERSTCVDETNTWHCLEFIGDFRGYDWKDKKLNISDSGFILTGPLGAFNRLWFGNVRIGFRVNFIRLHDSQGTILSGLNINSTHLCVEARNAGDEFDWMILDAYLGFLEMAGGFRIPIGFGALSGNLELIDGVQIIGNGNKPVESAILQQVIYPEAAIDRLSSSNSKGQDATINNQKPIPCETSLKAFNGGYLTTTFVKLCSHQSTQVSAFVTDSVSKLRRQSNNLIFIHIDVIVDSRNRHDELLVIRLNGRTLTGESDVKTSEVMRITWDPNNLHFNPSDGQNSFENVQTPNEHGTAGGRLTLTISDEGTVANFTFTAVGKMHDRKYITIRKIITKKLLLATQIDNGLEITAQVPQSRGCEVCNMTVTIDRRGVPSIPQKWSPKDQNPQTVLPPINYAVAPVKKSTGGEPTFIAYRSFTLQWSELDVKDSREDFRNWITRMRSLLAPSDVTIIYKNSWPVCPIGYHLVIPNPPYCAPCPPGTYAVPYRTSGKAIYEMLVKEPSWEQPHATVCVACPKGTFQTQPGSVNCTDCLQISNRIFCKKAEKDNKPSKPIKKHSPRTPFNITESKSHLRQAFAPGAFGVFFLCFCILGLLGGVVYFFLESIGFMLVAISKATRSEQLKAQKRANRICKKEVERLKKLYPDIDFEKIVREEVCKAEILELRESHPELDWESIICDTHICWLQKCYPYIRWTRILLEELPDVIREKYPQIDWDHIIAEYKCEKEIEEMKAAYPEIDWEHLLCETKIEHLRKNIPYLNWDGMVCEQRIQQLREACPDINFDNVVRNAICESEINKLTSRYPNINWTKILAEERILWLRARHPMINWENIVCEARVSKLRYLYPEINWENIIQDFICENEIEEIKRRFNCLDWESIIKGSDPTSIRMNAPEAVKRLTARFPNVAWEQIITEHLSDCAIVRLRQTYPYLDWNTITTAIFHPLSNKSANFVRPEIFQKFRSFVPQLECVYPHVDWTYFVEKQYASPYINWDYILREGDFNPYPSGCILKNTAIDKLNEKYPHVSWNTFLNVGVEKMVEDHPYIHWNVVLDTDDICRSDSWAAITEEQSQVDESINRSGEATTKNEQEKTSENQETNEPLKEEENLLNEYRIYKIGPFHKSSLRSIRGSVIQGGIPRISITPSNEINDLTGNQQQSSSFVSIVDHELSSRRLDESEL